MFLLFLIFHVYTKFMVNYFSDLVKSSLLPKDHNIFIVKNKTLKSEIF